MERDEVKMNGVKRKGKKVCRDLKGRLKSKQTDRQTEDIHTDNSQTDRQIKLCIVVQILHSG